MDNTINLDQITIKRAKEDRDRAHDDEVIFALLIKLQTENQQLKAQLEELQKPKE